MICLEPVLDPELQICDPHHHLWDGPGERGRYLVDDFLADIEGAGIKGAGIGGHKVVSSVFFECGTKYHIPDRIKGKPEMAPVGETEFVESITRDCHSNGNKDRETTIAAGIVGFVDLTLGSKAVAVIDAHMEAGKGRFRGVRQSCTWDADPTIVSLAKHSGMLAERAFREGFARLADYDLSFDAWQYFTQLGELADLAEEFPYTPIIVNHTGGVLGIGPYVGKADQVYQAWLKGITRLSVYPNVFMKLGGLGMPRCGFDWHLRAQPVSSVELANTFGPYLLACIEAFGVDHCMFESNFPVDKQSYSYRVVWNAFKRLTKDFSADERTALFHDNAAHMYRTAK